MSTYHGAKKTNRSRRQRMMLAARGRMASGRASAATASKGNSSH